MLRKFFVPLVGTAMVVAVAIVLWSMSQSQRLAPVSEPPAAPDAAADPVAEAAAPAPAPRPPPLAEAPAPAPAIAAAELPAPVPLPETVTGSARVPMRGVLIVGDVWIHLDGLKPPRENGDCRRFAVVFQCTLVSRGALAEVVAGKILECAVTRYAQDERNWGTCVEVDRATGQAIPDVPTINAQLVLVGWAFADPLHSDALVEAAAQAEANGVGLWKTFIRTGTNFSDTIFGNAIIRGATILDVREIDIHLLGIEAPEPVQQCTQNGASYPCGVMARAHIITLLAGKAVFCNVQRFGGDERGWGVCTETDRTGRVALPGARSVNEMMVRSGWAVAVPRGGADFSAAQAAAQAEGAGMWGGDFVSPANWRAGER